MIGRFFLFLVGKKESKNLTLDFRTQANTYFSYKVAVLYGKKKKKIKLNQTRPCNKMKMRYKFLYKDTPTVYAFLKIKLKAVMYLYDHPNKVESEALNFILKPVIQSITWLNVQHNCPTI